MEETTNLDEALISEWTTAVEALDSDSIKELFDIRPELLWTPLTPLSHLEADFAHFVQRLEDYKLLGTIIRPVYALHHILYDYGVPDDEWALERIELVDFILKSTKGNELNACLWGDEQNTIMHLAYFLNQPELIQQLNEYGAQTNIPNKSGHLPLAPITDTKDVNESSSTASEPEVKLLTTKSKSTTLKDKSQISASDRFKRLRELAESPNAAGNTGNKALTERQNSTRRYFRPGHLEERKRRVLSEEEEAELEKQKLKRQKEVEQLAQRSAVKNNPLFKRFEEQQQQLQQQQTKRTPSITAASAVRDRKKLLGAGDQIRRSSRVINSLKDRSYVSTSVFRQAQDAEAAAATASGKSWKGPTLAQLRGDSPMAKDSLPTVTDEDEEETVEMTIDIEEIIPNEKKEEETITPTTIMEPKVKAATQTNDNNSALDKPSDAQDIKQETNNISIRKTDPSPTSKLDSKNNSNKTGVIEDQVESLSVRKLGDRAAPNNLKVTSDNNKKAIEINSSKVKEIANMHEHLNDQEEIEIYSAGRTFAVWGSKNGNGQVDVENGKENSITYKDKIISVEQSKDIVAEKKSILNLPLEKEKDTSSKNSVDNELPSKDKSNNKSALEKNQPLTPDEQVSLPNKLSLNKQSKNTSEEESYKTGKKWTMKDQSIEQKESVSSITTVNESPTKVKSNDKPALEKEQPLTPDKQVNLPNKQSLSKQSKNAPEEESYKTGKKWTMNDQSIEQKQSASSIATVSTFKLTQESPLIDDTKNTVSILAEKDLANAAIDKSESAAIANSVDTTKKDELVSKSFMDTQSLLVSNINGTSEIIVNDHTQQTIRALYDVRALPSIPPLIEATTKEDIPNFTSSTKGGSSYSSRDAPKEESTSSSVAYLKDDAVLKTSIFAAVVPTIKDNASSISIEEDQSEFNNTTTKKPSVSNNIKRNEIASTPLSKSSQDMLLTPNDDEDDDFSATYHKNTTTKISTFTNNNYLNTPAYNNTTQIEEEEEQQQPNHVLHLEINTNKSQIVVDEESDEDEATTPTMANPRPLLQQQQQQKKKQKAAIEESDDEDSRHEWKSAYDQLMSNQQEMEFEDDILNHHNKTMNKSNSAEAENRLSFSSDLDESTILKTLNYHNEANLDTWNVNRNDLGQPSTPNQNGQWSGDIEHSIQKRESQLSKGGDSVAASSEAGSEQWFDPNDDWNEQQEEIRRQSSLLNTRFQIPPHEDYYYKKSEEEGYKRHSDSSINTNSETYSNKNSNSTENTNHDEDDERKRYQPEIEVEEEDYDYYSTNLHKTTNTMSEQSTTATATVQVNDNKMDYYPTHLHTSTAANNNKTRGESSYYYGGPPDPHQEQEEGEITVFMDQFASPSAVHEVKGQSMQKSPSQRSQDITTAFFNNSSKPILAQHEAPKPLTAVFSSSSLSVNQIHHTNDLSSSSLSVNQIHQREDDEMSLIKVPSRIIPIAEVGRQQDEVPLDPNHPRVEDISHYMNKLPAFDQTTNDIVPGGSAFDAAALSAGLENETVVIKRAISTSRPEGAQPTEQRGIPNAHEINFSMLADRRFDVETDNKISMSSTEASEFGKMYIGVSGAHNMLLPLPKEITYVRCVISDGEYEYMSRYEILGPQILMDYECVIDTRPGMIITVSLHVRPDYHVKPRTGWSRWLTSIRKQKEQLSGYVHPEDGAIGQTRFAVDHMAPGCYKKTYESHFDCFNSWYARTSRERARREQFGDDEDFLKIIGRLNVEMLYLPVSNPSAQVPRSLRECDLTIKIRQWHDTCWQSGYLSTRRQGLKVWERHYYRLIGSQLIGYTTDGGDRQVWDHYNMSDVIRLSAAADKVLVALTMEENDGKVFGQDTIHTQNHKGFFRLAFPDYHLDCVSDDLEESEEWVKTLKSMIGRVPLRLPFSD